MISIDWTLGLQFINFVVLMLALNVILYRPLRKVMQQRKETVDGSYRKAKSLEGAIDEKMAHYQEQLQQAKLKGNQEKNELRSQAHAEEGKILSAARATATEYMDTIKVKVASEADRARQALKAETEGLAAQIASKVLGRGL
ncbi:ATP synthase F0 b' subunit [Desulfuromonas soudanensis]|uniref:ATP synthase subunit b n=1 Tax=Desulfuromonas soudanensis TaxID=1603606 RepID=A0A0M5ILT6_9BACT|nr:ATP synthase F0 subunit B [Desulfuromonas soudanensis]ALC18298.1 ATP synthase F0 b' subunit [Desulfuromonas soudanensis]